MKSATLHLLLSPNARAEDVFGKGADADSVHACFLRLARVLHPDLNPGDADLAKAMARLTELREDASARIAAGTYGKAAPVSIKTKAAEYTNVVGLAAGDISDVYTGECPAGPVIIKVVRSPRDNDLADNEVAALKEIRDGTPDLMKFARRFPKIVDVADLPGKRRALVFNRRSGDWYTLSEILKVKGPLHLEDAAWMWRRAVEVLFYAHHRGWVHGAITADHLVLRPSDHAGMLIDWSYATRIGGIQKAAPQGAFLPAEVIAKRPVSRATDVSMAAELLRKMLRDVDVSTFRFLAACQLSQSARHQTAELAYQEFSDLLLKKFGPPKFRPFEMPKIN